MKAFLVTLITAASFGFASCIAADQTQVHFLQFPGSDEAALGQIEKLAVTVSCSWIVAMKNVPELYSIEMGYIMPTENVFEARPRLGTAAATLSRWNGVIGVRIPSDPGAKTCFEVTVTAEGRTGATRTWKEHQLGLTR